MVALILLGEEEKTEGRAVLTRWGLLSACVASNHNNNNNNDHHCCSHARITRASLAVLQQELAEVECEYTSKLQPLRLARVFLDQDKDAATAAYSTVKQMSLEVGGSRLAWSCNALLG